MRHRHSSFIPVKRQSTSINVNQRQSTPVKSINVNQRQSTSINVNQRQSTPVKSINVNQRQSTPVKSINVKNKGSTRTLALGSGSTQVRQRRAPARAFPPPQ
jgi:hypothetical protein